MSERPFTDLSYREYLSEEKLMGSRCINCGAIFVPPRPICIHCFGSDMAWEPMSGKGRLAAFTCISVGPPAMVAEGYTRDRPYCSGVVELKESVRVDARIEGVDTTRPETIRVGMPMTADFIHKDADGEVKTVLAFRPAG